jgi:dTDP-4-dehydrorhamnose reductase
MLGTELVRQCAEQNLQVCPTDRDVDITSLSLLTDYAYICKPKWIINCVGIKKTEEESLDPKLAFDLNARGVWNIAQVAEGLGVPLVHVSSDHVFSGVAEAPLDEDEPPSPLGLFGSSKLAGEQMLSTIQRVFVLRISQLYGFNGDNLIYRALKTMISGKPLYMSSDQFNSPTWTRDVVSAILNIILSNSTAYGTYHCACSGSVSKYDFVRTVAWHARLSGILQREPYIVSCNSRVVSERIEWPRNVVLDQEKLKKTFDIELPPWEASVKEFMLDLALNVDERQFWLAEAI